MLNQQNGNMTLLLLRQSPSVNKFKKLSIWTISGCYEHNGQTLTFYEVMKSIIQYIEALKALSQSNVLLY